MATKITAEQFNRSYPVGSRFEYFPLKSDPTFVETKTRSHAWALGSGDVVVLIEGRTGGVSVEHLRHIPDLSSLKENP